MTSSSKGPFSDVPRIAKFQSSVPDAPGLIGAMADHPARRARSEALSDDAQKAEVVRKAVCRMADRVRLRGKDLAEILGVSPSYVSKMRKATAAPAVHSHPFENALLLIRTLDALWSFIADEQGVNSYLYNPHQALGQIPIEKMKHPEGLVDMTRYVESKVH